MMRCTPKLTAAGRLLPCLIVLIASVEFASGADWPQWRGPEGNGISRESGLPVQWSESSGVVWKCELPPWGTSTPAIWGQAIFLTSHVDDERLVLVRIDKPTGRIVWTRQIGVGTARRESSKKGGGGGDRGRQKFHLTQNLASSSPVTDGQVVVVHFGNGALAAYDFEGQQLWLRNLQDDYGIYSIWWGHANSPVLVGNLVISVCMQDTLVDLGKPRSPSYVVAHDKRTGREVWKSMRPTEAQAEDGDSYTTPLVWNHDGRTELVVMGGQILDAYEPTSGKRLWSLPGLGGSRVITGPVIDDGVCYLTEGKRGAILAVRLGGEGELKERILWRHEQATPDTPSPAVWQGRVFSVSDNGIALCLDAKTGKLHWQERLKGNYRASPMVAEGRVYFLNMKGLATVVAASDRFERLAENALEDDTIASPATSEGKLFLRGHKALYCVGKK